MVTVLVGVMVGDGVIVTVGVSVGKPPPSASAGRGTPNHKINRPRIRVKRCGSTRTDEDLITATFLFTVEQKFHASILP